METEKNSYLDIRPVSGRRIVDINYLLRELQEKAHHNNLFDCKSANFQLIGEKRIGLLSIFKFECNMCKETCLIRSESESETVNVNVNIAAVTGIVATGIGFSQFEELCSAMQIPVFSPKYYMQQQDKVYESWEKTAVASMNAAAEEEKKIAIAEGRIKNGYPVVDVYCDGSWCARSYGTNYKAPSGAAAIIGRRTRKVLYIGIKNKYCLVCARASNKNVVPKEHTCFKNFEGSSSSMEAEIMAEGFKSSIPMYGLIYGRMIADGDASTYAKVLKAKPYESQSLTVEKIECKNHILRNFCKKLRGLTTETKYLLAHRKTLTNERIMTMRKVIVKSIRHHNSSESPRNTAISVLNRDVINSVAHAYGDHTMCQNYYCNKEKNDNNFKIIQNSTFLFRVNAIISNVAAKSRSLIENVDTNTVECFNNVIAKFIGGKRVNFALRRGYQGRCSAAVVSFNSESAISSVQKTVTNSSPGGIVEKIEKKRAQKRKLNVMNPAKKRKILKETTHNRQHDYGPNSSTPDMPHNELEIAKEDFLKNLRMLTMDRKSIERSTVLQKDSGEWLEIRKNLITASNFGPVCKRKTTLGTAPLVRNILYKKNLAHIGSIAHGIEHEQQALQQLQQQENVTILPCGLFIDKIYPFIGATPDGLIGEDTVVEIKCPLTASKKGLSAAITEQKIQIIKYNKKTKTTSINENCNWYYQIQGQLHVTERPRCLLGIWEGENKPVHVEYIFKNDKFWEEKMEPKLKQFYLKCLLPEIVDARHTRGMAIRNLPLQDDKENVTNPLSSPEPQLTSNSEQPGPSTQQNEISFWEY